MDELTVPMLIAVSEEMFGRLLFWGLVVVSIVATLLFIWVLVRDRKIESRRLVHAELWAPVGTVISIALVFLITNSGFADLGGPIDVIVLILIGLAGAIGMTMLAYIGQALLSSKDKKIKRLPT